ncbi:MAG: phosphatase family protein [Francisellaceae bacterium]|nr:phosphatase family protein [Francisellaceae bacterium]
MENQLIILDRDGVINFDSKDFIKNVDEWIPIPHSLEAISRLNQIGFIVVIATNQSGVGRGYYDLQTLDAIHNKMLTLLAEVGGSINGIYYCPHKPEDNCLCRKPKTGLFFDIYKDFSIDPVRDKIVCVGDSLRDLEAGYNSGCVPILVKTGNGIKTLKQLPDYLKNIQVFDNLSHFVDNINQ